MRTHNSERLSDRLGGCNPSVLARDFGTPLLVIDEVCLRSQIRAFRSAFMRDRWRASVTYAGKALLVAAIARIAHEEGLAVDVCSLGELETALRAGMPAKRCILHGCYKTPDELDAAVEKGVGYVVIDHADEIGQLGKRARTAEITCDVLLRVNPEISATTHEFVQTGTPASKFGFPISDGQAIAAVRMTLHESALRLGGIHCHLGSQIYDVATYARAIDVLAAFAKTAHAETGVVFDVFDLGGGLAVGHPGAGEPSCESWACAIFDALERHYAASERPKPHIFVEPGRALIAPVGTTLYRIGVRKRLPDGTEALVIDGGMSDNPRPALYDAHYQVSVADRPDAAPDGSYTIYGRHCETDRLFPDVGLPDPQPGDLLAVRDTGAYTYSMASNYNRFPRPAVVLASAGSARLIARREPLAHVLDLDVVEHT
jgi:diaminopimelate decarboxylase